MGMKKRITKTPQLHLDYMYMYGASNAHQAICRYEMKRLKRLAQKTQTSLGKVKKTICKVCSSLMIPKVTCSAEFLKRESGFGLEINCWCCKAVHFTAARKDEGPEQ